MSFLRRGFLKSANRPNHLCCRSDASPIAAIVIVLLYLFIGPSLVVVHPRSVLVDMAEVSHSTPFPEALREDAIIVTVTRDGTRYLGNTRILRGDLPDQIHQAINDGAYNTIFLKTDARAKYGDVSAVVAMISASGLQHVVLLVESARRPGP